MLCVSASIPADASVYHWTGGDYTNVAGSRVNTGVAGLVLPKRLTAK
jgi:hypothetical protein